MKFGILVFLALLPALGASPPQAGPPVPQQIFTAQTAFVANGGVRCAGMGPDRAYRDLYSDLSRWGRYRLVPAPADAQLILTISLDCPTVPAVARGSATAPDSWPRLTLDILDPPSRVSLWSVTQLITPALLQRHRDENVDHGVAVLVAQLQNLRLNLPARPAPPPRIHRNWTPVVIGAIAAVAGAVVFALIARHNMRRLSPPPGFPATGAP